MKIDISMVTITAVLIAVLSLWAQLWYRYADHSKTSDKPKAILVSATFGLFWIYIAILLALIALAMLISQALFDWDIVSCAQGFIITSFLMGFLNIADSTYSILIKVHKDMTAFQPLLHVESIASLKCWFCVTILFALLLLLFSVLATMLSRWWFVGDLVIILIGFLLYNVKIVVQK